MTTQLARGFFLAWTLVTVTAAQSSQGTQPKLPGEDWVSLFNGKDLSGWIKIGNEQWTVENGIIHGVAVTKDYGYLMTEKPYRDFHLFIKFLCEGDGNSGVFFHTAFKPGTADVSQGLQFEVDCTIMQHTGGIYGDGREWVVALRPRTRRSFARANGTSIC